MSENGQVEADIAASVMEQAPARLRLDPDELTPKDIKRARVMFGGRDPWEVLDDPDDKFTLTIWCLKSRTDPGFTWEQAEETPFGTFDPPEQRVPPQIPLPESSGSGASKTNGSGSKPTRRRPAPASSSSSSTD